MIELELIREEVELVTAGLRFRGFGMGDERREVYLKLADRIDAVGLHQFDRLEAVCIALGLHDFAMRIDNWKLSDQAKRLAEQVFELANKRPFSRFLEACPHLDGGLPEMAGVAYAG